MSVTSGAYYKQSCVFLCSYFSSMFMMFATNGAQPLVKESIYSSNNNKSSSSSNSGTSTLGFKLQNYLKRTTESNKFLFVCFQDPRHL